jgi:hypothetical protein
MCRQGVAGIEVARSRDAAVVTSGERSDSRMEWNCWTSRTTANCRRNICRVVGWLIGCLVGRMFDLLIDRLTVFGSFSFGSVGWVVICLILWLADRMFWILRQTVVCNYEISSLAQVSHAGTWKLSHNTEKSLQSLLYGPVNLSLDCMGRIAWNKLDKINKPLRGHNMFITLYWTIVKVQKERKRKSGASLCNLLFSAVYIGSMGFLCFAHE